MDARATVMAPFRERESEILDKLTARLRHEGCKELVLFPGLYLVSSIMDIGPRGYRLVIRGWKARWQVECGELWVVFRDGAWFPTRAARDACHYYAVPNKSAELAGYAPHRPADLWLIAHSIMRHIRFYPRPLILR